MDIDLFSHLELTFNLHDDKVTTSTAAKDIRGESYYKHILDTKTDSSIAFTGSDVTSYRYPGEASSTQVPASPSAPPVAVWESKEVQEPYASMYKGGNDWASPSGNDYWNYANSYTGETEKKSGGSAAEPW